MKVLILIYCIFANIFLLLANDKSLNTGKIIIEVEGLKNSNGNVRSHLYNSDKFFPTLSDSAYRRVVAPIFEEKCTIVFEDLEFGEYAFTVHHDENLNIKMDRNFLGLPTEGWGISNNPKVIFTLPSFDSVKFKLDKKVIKLKVKMQY